MSHFTTIKIQFVAIEPLKKALADVRAEFQLGEIRANALVSGYQGNTTRADLFVATRNQGYDLGFRKQGDTYTKTGRDPAQFRACFPRLLQEAERVKEILTNAEAETFSVTDPDTGVSVQHRYTRGAFEDLLDTNGLYAKVNSVLDAAEGQAREHGYDKDQLQTVLLIGGSRLIPNIRRLVRSRYGERVRCERPLRCRRRRGRRLHRRRGLR